MFAFVLLYKLGDTAMGPMVKPFWVDRGLTVDGDRARLDDVRRRRDDRRRARRRRADVALGDLPRPLDARAPAGALEPRLRRRRRGPTPAAPAIYAASLVESFTGGLGTAAFLAFLMHVCDKQQAATQYALLSALFNLSGSLAGALSGLGAQRLGYGPYFALTFVLALPAYALLPWVRGWVGQDGAAGFERGAVAAPGKSDLRR